MKELLVFTHNDADALGCMLNIEYKLTDKSMKYFHTNYANIPQLVDSIIEYKNTHDCYDMLFIPDVSFSDNKEHLRTLYNAFSKVVHIDHHLYPEGFWDEFPNMKVVWDKKKSATQLCNEFFENTGKNKRLDQLTRLIDVYDIWQKDEPEFSVAQDLNEFFWTYDIGLLCKEIIQNDFKLPPTYTEVVAGIKNTYNTAIENYESRNLIHRSGKITIAFIDDWFNQVMLREHDNGQDFVIGLNTYGIVRIRVNQDVECSNEALDNIRLALTGTKDIGHMHAFTYKTKNGLDNLMAEAKKIVGVISECV